MIKRLALKNWKSFAEGQLFIDPLTVLIGTNASGKSNILDALIFLQKLANGQPMTTAVNGDSVDPVGIRGGIEWVIRHGSETASLEVLIGSSRDALLDYRYSLEIGIVDETRVELVSESLYRIKRRENSDRAYERRLFNTEDRNEGGASLAVYFYSKTQGKGKRFDLRRTHSVLLQSQSMNLVKEVQDAVTEVMAHLQRIFVFDPIPSLMRDYAKIADKLQVNGANVAGVLAGLPMDERQETEAVLSSYLNRLPEREITEVWTEKIGKFETDAMLYAREKWGDDHSAFTVDARGMSDGSLRFLAIMTALLTAEAGSLLVIEEIDNGLHPSRAALLVAFLREVGSSRKIDIICTTHNPALLDAFGNEMIPFISLVHRDDKTGYSRVKLLEEIDQLPLLMARGKVGRLLTLGVLETAISE